MSDTCYQQIRDIARRQATAAAAGDLDEAIRLLDDRARLLADAGTPSRDEEDAIRETLQLDRAIGSAMRQRMISLRDESVRLQRSRTAVSGYRPPTGRSPRMLDTER